MKDITITGGQPNSLSWETYTGADAYFGEHANLINNNETGSGEVDLYFHPQKPTVSYPTPDIYYTYTTIPPLTPTTNNGGATVTYTISPALPTTLTLSPTSGIITGMPTATLAKTDYTITATNSAGGTPTTVTITINPQPTVSISYYIESTNTNIDDFILSVSDGWNSGPRGVSESNPITIAGTGSASGNSTVTMTFSYGPMPTSATLYGDFAPINGVISGSTITFSGANLTTVQTATININ